MRYSLEVEYNKDDGHWHAAAVSAETTITGEGCSIAAAIMEVGRGLELIYDMADEYDFTDARPLDFDDYQKDMP